MPSDRVTKGKLHGGETRVKNSPEPMTNDGRVDKMTTIGK